MSRKYRPQNDMLLMFVLVLEEKISVWLWNFQRCKKRS